MRPPYRMTREEWLRDGVEYVTTDSRGIQVSYFPRRGARVRRARTDSGHMWHIRCALLDGQQVPTRVLAEYPDFVRQCGFSITGQPLAPLGAK